MAQPCGFGGVIARKNFFVFFLVRRQTKWNKTTDTVNNNPAQEVSALKKAKVEKTKLPQEKIARITWKVRQITAGNVSKNDPNGSYTGVPLNTAELPVQDADDL